MRKIFIYLEYKVSIHFGLVDWIVHRSMSR